ncbi:MAG: hypothetical protein PHP26_02690 [Syntrophomonas sp.]|nr:hypothetical protein [Eubacteriales bacterium]MDD3878882.1 hypothetical protein [Syntrophomonas sp.]
MGSGSGNNSSPGQSSSSPEPGAGELAVMKWGDYEKIYDPQRIGRSGEISQVRGQAGEGPQQLIESDDPAIMPGSMRPYREVLAEYSKAARESLDRQPIPSGMTEVVKNYFSSLEE